MLTPFRGSPRALRVARERPERSAARPPALPPGLGKLRDQPGREGGRGRGLPSLLQLSPELGLLESHLKINLVLFKSGS